MNNKVPMTVLGEATLRAELEDLKKVQRPRIVAAIAEARAHGDLKENAEYHAARNEQSFTEGRVQEIEGKLGHAQVIDVSKMPAGDKVIFGVTVTIINTESDASVTYTIVGDDESDIKQSKISYQSPIARALIGKEIGDVVVVKAPSGDIEYEIDDVTRGSA
ncbi:MAG: transcription elongation factor GreA [Porticoccaceae bacterium]|nr:transcription elongation factor GreA [Porticoccaceae bacterium]